VYIIYLYILYIHFLIIKPVNVVRFCIPTYILSIGHTSYRNKRLVRITILHGTPFYSHIDVFCLNAILMFNGKLNWLLRLQKQAFMVYHLSLSICS
jgi:hypothetical protein